MRQGCESRSSPITRPCQKLDLHADVRRDVEDALDLVQWRDREPNSLKASMPKAVAEIVEGRDHELRPGLLLNEIGRACD